MYPTSPLPWRIQGFLSMLLFHFSYFIRVRGRSSRIGTAVYICFLNCCSPVQRRRVCAFSCQQADVIPSVFSAGLSVCTSLLALSTSEPVNVNTSPYAHAGGRRVSSLSLRGAVVVLDFRSLKRTVWKVEHTYQLLMQQHGAGIAMPTLMPTGSSIIA